MARKAPSPPPQKKKKKRSFSTTFRFPTVFVPRAQFATPQCWHFTTVSLLGFMDMLLHLL